MKIAILGTGTVGQTFAEKLTNLGHKVVIGTRNVLDTSMRGKFAEWHKNNPKVELKSFSETVSQGELIINALQGGITLSVLKSCNSADFDNKIVIDISNPLDFSKGFPPFLIEGLNNTNSLGEEVQKVLANAKVVKTLNTMWCGLMVNPTMINDGNHINYICGNDSEAKEQVKILLNEFGWKNENILDLGDITNARGTESTLLIWTRVYGATQSGAFNMNLVK
ncbi:MAG: NAD(P)-binding domain-containing protein [Bacteroidota bacterium]